jgi:DNA-directed RNA polymerase subunit omega
MIEALRSEEIIDKVGGRFKLTALIQKRLVELVHGARPLVERERGMTDMEVVIQEILEDKIAIQWEQSESASPEDVL